MKRASSPEAYLSGKHLRHAVLQCNSEIQASLVRLNVGGRRFDVSPETLSGAAPRLFVDCILVPEPQRQ